MRRLSRRMDRGPRLVDEFTFVELRVSADGHTVAIPIANVSPITPDTICTAAVVLDGLLADRIGHAPTYRAWSI